ncbi:extracellular solute-binding protein [Paenibacillus hemerocallicola]|uniref:Extracellular solute-binding protein n=1 Tax=Paenibacillus hemerocallicola TaxID=1172614 RepID=A0A5C4TAP2_9BACL|nr:extracellular solute-binding protein [Paenibacillus hemerocallicola]TNJ65517.1 extracellular solute-binding protein [Paenibacillus hemerocallicola]
MKSTTRKTGLAATAVILLVGVCALGMTAAWQNGKPAAEREGSETESVPFQQEQSITIKAFAGYSPAVASDWSRLRLWQSYEKLTGIHIDWQTVPASEVADRRNLLLSRGSEEWPDVLYGTQLSPLELVGYGASGVLIPLEELIDREAPFLGALLDRYPDVRRGMTMPDGHIYSLPMLYDPEFGSMLTGRKLWLSRSWLAKLGEKPPETTEELYRLLKRFASHDMNGNYKHDETALLVQDIDSLELVLKGAWGLGNRGAEHPFVDVNPRSGALRFIPTSPEYKELLQFMHRLYEEGLLDNRLFAINENEFLRLIREGNVGAFVGNGPPPSGEGEYTAAAALAGPRGDRLFAGVTHPLHRAGAFAITSSNRYPEAAIRWADYFYGEEGNRLFFLGIENETYRSTPAGTFAFTEAVAGKGDDAKAERMIGRFLIWPRAEYPGIVRQSTFMGAESSASALHGAESLKSALPAEVWPDFTYTPDENDLMIAYSADIQGYVAEMRDRFITGEVSFEAWDDYEVSLRRKGLTGYMAIYASAYKRFAMHDSRREQP